MIDLKLPADLAPRGYTLKKALLDLTPCADDELWNQSLLVLKLGRKPFEGGVRDAVGGSWKCFKSDEYVDVIVAFLMKLVETRALDYDPIKGDGRGFVYWAAKNATFDLLEPNRKNGTPDVTVYPDLKAEDALELAIRNEVQSVGREKMAKLRAEPGLEQFLLEQVKVKAISIPDAKSVLGRTPVTQGSATTRRSVAAAYILGNSYVLDNWTLKRLAKLALIPNHGTLARYVAQLLIELR